MTALTPRQQELLSFIGTYLKAYGIAPSYDQCGLAIGLIARSAVSKEIIALERAGMIRRIPAYKNAIELLPSEDNHAANCVCKRCADARYVARLNLVHALEVLPPFALVKKQLVGLRIPEAKTSQQTRVGASQ